MPVIYIRLKHVKNDKTQNNSKCISLPRSLLSQHWRNISSVSRYWQINSFKEIHFFFSDYHYVQVDFKVDASILIFRIPPLLWSFLLSLSRSVFKMKKIWSACMCVYVRRLRCCSLQHPKDKTVYQSITAAWLPSCVNNKKFHVPHNSLSLSLSYSFFRYITLVKFDYLWQCPSVSLFFRLAINKDNACNIPLQ